MTKRLGLHSAHDNERLACYDKAADAEQNAAEQTAAPISRGEYTPIMGPTTSPNRVTLSAEERALAAASAISEVKYA